MKVDQWVRRLNRIKRQEEPEAVLIVAGSAELMRIAVAWRGTQVSRKRRLSPCKAEDEATVWAWLWDNVDYSKADLLRRIPGASETSEQKFNALVANRVLYPDGSVNSFVQKYLKERVVNLFGLRRTARGKSVA